MSEALTALIVSGLVPVIGAFALYVKKSMEAGLLTHFRAIEERLDKIERCLWTVGLCDKDASK